MNENILKELFLFRNGENKGLLKLMESKKADGIIKSSMDRFLERRALIVSIEDLKTIKKMHDLCVNNPSVDSELAMHVECLYENIYLKSSFSMNDGDTNE